MDDLLIGISYILLINTTFAFAFMLAVLINLLINAILKQKVKSWHEYVGNLISFLISITILILVFKLTTLRTFILVCNIILISSTLIYTNKGILNKIYKYNRDVGKTLYKNENIFVLNIFIWLFYIITEIVLQLYNLELINISNSDLLFFLKANEASILIVLSSELFIKSIKNLIILKRKQKDDKENKSINDKSQ